jgi:hypothetical protein
MAQITTQLAITLDLQGSFCEFGIACVAAHGKLCGKYQTKQVIQSQA